MLERQLSPKLDAIYADAVMANLTISIDEEVLERTRLKALKEDQSVGALLEGFLIRYAGPRTEAQRATKEC